MIAAEQRYGEARARVARARAQALDTGAEIKDRLAPQTLAEKAVQSVRTAAQDAAVRGVEKLRSNPAPAAGAGLALTAFLFRRPIWRLATRALSRGRRRDHQD